MSQYIISIRGIKILKQKHGCEKGLQDIIVRNLHFFMNIHKYLLT